MIDNVRKGKRGTSQTSRQQVPSTRKDKLQESVGFLRIERVKNNNIAHGSLSIQPFKTCILFFSRFDSFNLLFYFLFVVSDKRRHQKIRRISFQEMPKAVLFFSSSHVSFGCFFFFRIENGGEREENGY